MLPPSMSYAAMLCHVCSRFTKDTIVTHTIHVLLPIYMYMHTPLVRVTVVLHILYMHTDIHVLTLCILCHNTVTTVTRTVRILIHMYPTVRE